MNKETEHYIEWFRHSTPYIKAHHSKVFVLWIGGEALACTNFNDLIHDINLLHSLGIKLVLVHGSRPQIDEHLKKASITSSFHKDLRISGIEHLDSICQASAMVRMKIEALFSLGLANSPMQGASLKLSSGNYVSAKPIGVIDGVDFEHTGEVRSINTKAISELLDARHIVLLSNIAYSPTGEMFNLNSEDVAKACAIAMQADKLIYFTESNGCSNKKGELLRELNPQHDINDISDKQLSYFKAGIEAVEAGVARTHIVSHEINGALIQELFTRDGSGTLISQMPYENLRQASIKDVAGIIELISPLEEQGVLVKRSREILENEIDRFTVLDRDGHIIACAALYIYDDAPLAELACICVSKDYQNGHRGDKLLDFIEGQARFLNIEKLFVLTTQTSHWFQERGFTKVSIDELPMSKRELYNYQRNSLIFIKDLH